MANNKYQEGGGKWFGGETMEGIMGKQFREFMAAFKSKMRLQAKKLKKRGLIKNVGKFLDTVTQIPVFSTIADQIAQKKYKLDPTLDVEAGMYTGGLKKEAEEQLSDLKKRADVSIAESLTTAGLEWAGTKAGKTFLNELFPFRKGSKEKVVGTKKGSIAKKFQGDIGETPYDIGETTELSKRGTEALNAPVRRSDTIRRPEPDLPRQLKKVALPPEMQFESPMARRYCGLDKLLGGVLPGGQRFDLSWLTNFLESLSKKDKLIIDFPIEIPQQGTPTTSFAREGGRVPKYYGGGSVNSSPTISDYFSQQGKTLGGSNLESLSEQLNRK